MLASLTTKMALKKVGLSADTFNFNNFNFGGSSATATKDEPPKRAVAVSKDGTIQGLDEADKPVDEKSGPAWPAWMTVKSLPLSVQPWLSPPPPPIPVAEPPRPGDLAPLDRDRKLVFGGGKRVVVVFLRCVGCACKS